MGYRVSGFAGSDSHRFQKSVENFKIFDYELTCRALNNHVYIPKPLVGDVERDKIIMQPYEWLFCRGGYDHFHCRLQFSSRYRHILSGSTNSDWNSATLNSNSGKIYLPINATEKCINNGKVFNQFR